MGLIIGEGADQVTLQRIRAIVQAQEGVQKVNEALTMYFGPHTILLNISLTFAGGQTVDAVASSARAIEPAVRAEYPDVKRVFVEVESVAAGV